MQEIRRIRKECKLTQRELADLSGVDPATISLIEAGKRRPHLETLDSLALALGVEVGDFFPKAQSRLWPEEEPERRDYDFRATRDTLDGFCNYWSRRLIKRDLNPQAFDELHITISTLTPFLMTTLETERKELAASGHDFFKASIVWPAAERFQGLLDDLREVVSDVDGENAEADEQREQMKAWTRQIA